MGSLTFCQEYIEYLKACNTNLRDELEKVRNIEKNRVVSKELRNTDVDMTTNEITSICNSACEAIDDLFQNFTTTMNSLKNVLLWKSQISMIPKKYSLALTGDQNELNVLSPSLNNESDVPSLTDVPENRSGKKLGGTAKVSPMINGHIISTPTIHLSRVSEDFDPPNRMVSGPLSPILEMSPESPQVNSSPVFRDLRIPLRRLHINTFSRRTSEGSRDTNKPTKFAFIRKRPASFDLKKHCSSLKESRNFPEANEREVETDQENREDEERSTEVENSMVEENEESPSNRFEAKENHEPGASNSDEVDPLEGPSWLLDRPRKSGKSRSSSPNDSPFRYGFVNFKRRGAISSATLQCQSAVEGNKKKEVLNFSENAELDDFDTNKKMECGLSVAQKTQTRRERSLSSSDLEEENEDNRELDDQYCEFKNDGISKESLDFRNPARRSSLRGMYVRKSNDSMTLAYNQKLSNKTGSSLNNSKIENKSSATPVQGKNCSVNLVRLSSTVTDASENCTPNKLRREAVETVIVSPNPCRRSVKRVSTPVRKTPIQINERVKRRAAEVCTQNRKWIEITPKGEKSSKGRSGKKKTSYKKKV